MTKYACNEEGVQALNTTANNILKSSEVIKKYTEYTSKVADQHQDALGPHYTGLINQLSIVEHYVYDANNAVEEIAEVLTVIAEGYQDVIDDESLSVGQHVAKTIAGVAAAVGIGGSKNSVFGGKGVDGLICTPPDVAADIRSKGADFCNGCPPEGQSAITAYSGSTYDAINGRLRGINPPGSISDETKATMRTLHTTLKGASLPHDCIVYRGASSKALGRYASLSDDQIVGKIIHDDAFVSTSLDIDVAKDFSKGVILVIEAPKGSHGAHIGSKSQYHYREDEVLFDAGQKMKVLGAERKGPYRYLRVRMI